ncbi:MAG: glycosyl hydrolase [Spirochaetaceae bacterium]|nr:MAG: glycosyl hydrolase [Spirochaetaceae bacterium]
MIGIDTSATAADLQPALDRFFSLAAGKINALHRRWDPAAGTPVFTVAGKYASRGWTEWTQGFQFGNAIYQYDATGDKSFLEMGRRATVEVMASHVSHIGVHDHGFNNVSTYGNLLRLMREGRIPENEWEREFYKLAIKISGAVQAARWTPTADGLGFIHSFNGAHSLFSDTIRSLRVLALGHRFGHVLMGEQDEKTPLLRRYLQHAETTARYNVYFGTGRDSYDTRGRVVHESIFNTRNGVYRCPSTQQGYSPFSTWTRGLSWILSGYAEELEFLTTVTDGEIAATGIREFPAKEAVAARFLETARATADFFIENTPTDGIPYWDTGAPGLEKMPGYLDRPADPFNGHEPVDSSAAAICAQGYLRLGRYLKGAGAAPGETAAAGERYFQTGLTIARSLFAEPYLSPDPDHEGMLLHSIYHQPNGWDHVPTGATVAHGESCMWGDYHLMELAVYLQRLAAGGPYLTFFNV